jgi:hypothetical protein
MIRIQPGYPTIRGAFNQPRLTVTALSIVPFFTYGIA